MLETRNSQMGVGVHDSVFGFRHSFVIRHSGFVLTPCLLRVIPATRTSLAVLLLLIWSACAHTVSRPGAGPEQQVRAVLEAQVRAWNVGNLHGFMEGYAQSQRTRFQSGGDVSLGWQTVFERYQKRYGEDRK